jgi:hypothetical protein
MSNVWEPKIFMGRAVEGWLVPDLVSFPPEVSAIVVDDESARVLTATGWSAVAVNDWIVRCLPGADEETRRALSLRDENDITVVPPAIAAQSLSDPAEPTE